MLYVDVPTLDEFKSLHAHRDEACVSIYLETTPLSQFSEASRIELGNLMRKAAAQLEENGVDKNRIATMTQEVADLGLDHGFWRLQAHSLAVFITPTFFRTFRLPNRLSSTVQVSDRFQLKPLLRSITFKNSAFVLALSEKPRAWLKCLPICRLLKFRYPTSRMARPNLSNATRQTRYFTIPAYRRPRVKRSDWSSTRARLTEPCAPYWLGATYL